MGNRGSRVVLVQLPSDPEPRGRLLPEAAGAPAPLPVHDSRLASRAAGREGRPGAQRSAPLAVSNAAHGKDPRFGVQK